jgi:type I restriction enzyme S subunit
MQHVNRKEFLSTELALPPLDEQRRIADILDKADALRAKRRSALRAIDPLAHSIFDEIFGNPTSKSRGPWPVRSMEEISSKITDGTHRTPRYTASGVLFMSAKDLKNGGIDWQTGKYISPEEHADLVRRCNPECGDILLAKSGSLGSVAIVDRSETFSLFESLCLVKYDRKAMCGPYLVWLLRHPSMLSQLLEFNKGIAIKHLHLEDIRRLPVPVPPIELQREFAVRIDAVEQLKSRLTRSAAALDHVFASLQHRAFSGTL